MSTGNTIRELLIKVGLDSSAAITGFKKLEGSVLSLKHLAFGTIAALTGIATTLAGVAYSTAIAGADTARSAKLFGMSTVEFQKLSYAANIARVDTQQFLMSMKFFGMESGKALQGNSEALKNMRMAGINTFRDSNGQLKTQTQLLLEIAAHLQTVGSAQQKIAIVREIFGRQGTAMMDFLDKGSRGIADLNRSFGIFGHVFSPEDIKNSQIMVTNLNLLKESFIGIKNEIGAALLPILNKWTTSLLLVIGLHKRFGSDIDAYLDRLPKKFKDTAKEIDDVLLALKLIVDVLYAPLWLLEKLLWSIGVMAKEVLALLDRVNTGVTSKTALDEYTGIGGATKYLNLAETAKPQFSRFGANTTTQKVINIQNKPTVNITVPEGTTDMQKSWFKNMIENHLTEAINKELVSTVLSKPLLEKT
jgi:hypothetical protein